MNPLHLVVDWLYNQPCPKTTSNLALTCKFFSSPNSITTVKTNLTCETVNYFKKNFHLIPSKQAKIAAAVGNIELLKDALNGRSFKFEKIYEKAAANGHVDVLKWCFERDNYAVTHKKYLLPRRAFKKAIRNNQFCVFDWAKEKDLAYYIEDVTWWSAKYGNFEMVKYFNVVNEWICRGAARSGRLDILQWAFEKEPKYLDVPEIQYDAASYGNLHILQWFFDTGAVVEFETITVAALETGDMNILRFVIQHGADAPAEHWIEKAIEAGQFEMVKWLLSNFELSLTRPTYWISAVNHENLEMLNLLYEHKVPFPSNDVPFPSNDALCFDAATHEGNFEILEWLVDHGLSTDRICLGAIFSDNPERVLDWAKARGIEPSFDDFLEAAKEGSEAYFQWALDNGCHLSRKIWHEAARSGQVELLVWAKEQGIQFGKTLCNCASKEGQFQVLQWAHHNGIPWSIKVIVNAAEYGDKKMVKWAGKNYRKQAKS